MRGIQRWIIILLAALLVIPLSRVAAQVDLGLSGISVARTSDTTARVEVQSFLGDARSDSSFLLTEIEFLVSTDSVNFVPIGRVVFDVLGGKYNDDCPCGEIDGIQEKDCTIDKKCPKKKINGKEYDGDCVVLEQIDDNGEPTGKKYCACIYYPDPKGQSFIITPYIAEDSLFIKAIIDPDTSISEIDENNNSLVTTFHAGTIPTLTEWGLIIFGVVLLGFISWVFLKRRKVVGVGV
jgi:hypothetical protein